MLKIRPRFIGLVAAGVLAGGLGIASALYWAWADDWSGIDGVGATWLASGVTSVDFTRFQPRFWACSSAPSVPIDNRSRRSSEMPETGDSSTLKMGPDDRGSNGSIEARDHSHPWRGDEHATKLVRAASPPQFSRSSARMTGVARIRESPERSSRAHDGLRLAAFARQTPVAS